MGMYTEFIFGCELSKDTPKVCIDALDREINDEWDNGNRIRKPKYDNPQTYEEERFNERYIERTTSDEEIDKFIEEYDIDRLFFSSSYYFGAANPVHKFYYDEISKSYHISTRADLKNYHGQIEKFIEYIKPYVEHASGPNDVFAYVQYEESDFPTVYSLLGEHHIGDPETIQKYKENDEKRWKIFEKLYTELAPEYEVTKEELDKHGVEPGKETYGDVWEWMCEYIIEKYKNNGDSKDRGDTI